MKKKSRILLLMFVLAGLSTALSMGWIPLISTSNVKAASNERGAKPPALENADSVDGVWKAPDQEAAMARAKETVPFVDTVIDECLLCRQQKLRDQGLNTKDIEHSYVLLNSPIINQREDNYGPVRFMHSKHASTLKDCAVCHHFRPTDPEALETTRCSACHQDSFREDQPDRIGLRAAYHINCVECHKQMNQGPIDCAGCHQKKVPDHKQLVKLSENPKPTDVTRECLRCHKEAGEDMLSTVHWQWKGHSPYTMEHRKEVQHGKATTTINNF